MTDENAQLPSQSGAPSTPDVGVVVLTMGNRPEELNRGIESLLAQQDVKLDILCVGNGWEPVGVPDQVRTLYLPENLGACGGRNAGAANTSGRVVFFFDDDAWLTDPQLVSKAVREFDSRPDLGLLQPRVHDPLGTEDPVRWIPRLRKGDRFRSSNAFSVWEGALFARREMFEQVGGFADELFYYHEGIELAWQCWNARFQAWYQADLEVHHPSEAPTRHAMYHRMNARNRVLIARRNLPAPLRFAYTSTWGAINRLNMRGSDDESKQAWRDGWREGWAQELDPSTRLSWRTIAKMTGDGRPPVI